MFIGIDLGGTKVAAGVVEGGRVLRKVVFPTDARKGKEHVLGQIRTAVTQLYAPERTPIGIGVPGVVDGTTIRYLTNIPCLKGVDLGKEFKVPVRVQNDARCFTLAEQRHGAGKGAKNVLGLVIGTGLGCGVIIDGRIHEGAHNFAGEIGFARHPSGCTWEEYLAGPGILKRYGRGATSVSEIWSARTSAAKGAFNREVEGLAEYLHMLALVLDPEVIVLGGGVAQKRLVRAVDQALRARLRRQGVAPKVRAAMVPDAGIVGAAELHAARP